MLIELMSGPMDGMKLEVSAQTLIGTKYIYIDRNPQELCKMAVERQGVARPLTTPVYRIKLGGKGEKHLAEYSHNEEQEENP